MKNLFKILSPLLVLLVFSSCNELRKSNDDRDYIHNSSSEKLQAKEHMDLIEGKETTNEDSSIYIQSNDTVSEKSDTHSISANVISVFIVLLTILLWIALGASTKNKYP